MDSHATVPQVGETRRHPDGEFVFVSDRRELTVEYDFGDGRIGVTMIPEFESWPLVEGKGEASA